MRGDRQLHIFLKIRKNYVLQKKAALPDQNR